MTDISPFTVDVPEERVADLTDRIGRARWPDQLPGTGWSRGSDLRYMQEFCEYWRTEFDWRQVEAALNEWPQFVTTIDGQRVHFVHARSSYSEALPLLMTHGWPGSVLEFLKVLGPLTDPVAHGGRAEDAFHVVCPSLPGFAFSGPTREVGWDIRRVARAEVELMRRLGYDRYAVQGGDWGAYASVEVTREAPERVVGLHLNLVIATPPDGVAAAPPLVPEPTERAYSQIQGTRPLTLGYGLVDSPAGYAAWVVEKFRAWSDCGGDVESRFTKDEMLSHICSYWFTDTVSSSIRLYHETHTADRRRAQPSYIDVPTACALYPAELFRPPREWAERRYNVVRWTKMAHGGHFAAHEEPQAFVADLRDFYASRR